MQRTLMVQVALQSRIIGGSIPQQMREVMGKRVQQFHDGLVIVAIGRGEQEAQNDPRQAKTLWILQPKYFIALLLHTP